MFLCPDASFLLSREIEIHDTSFVCPFKNASFSVRKFLITTNDPKGKIMYLPQGVYNRPPLIFPKTNQNYIKKRITSK